MGKNLQCRGKTCVRVTISCAQCQKTELVEVDLHDLLAGHVTPPPGWSSTFPAPDGLAWGCSICAVKQYLKPIPKVLER